MTYCLKTAICLRLKLTLKLPLFLFFCFFGPQNVLTVPWKRNRHIDFPAEYKEPLYPVYTHRVSCQISTVLLTLTVFSYGVMPELGLVCLASAFLLGYQSSVSSGERSSSLHQYSLLFYFNLNIQILNVSLFWLDFNIFHSFQDSVYFNFSIRQIIFSV